MSGLRFQYSIVSSSYSIYVTIPLMTVVILNSALQKIISFIYNLVNVIENKLLNPNENLCSHMTEI